MITPRPHLLAALILSLVACSTQHLDGDEVNATFPAGFDYGFTFGGSIPESAGHLRFKTNGKFLVWRYDDQHFVYFSIEGGGHRFMGLPAGIPLDLVNDAGEALLHVDAVTPFPGPLPTTLWVHDSPNGLAAELLDVRPDDDPTTQQVRVANVSAAQRVTVYRCVGTTGCPDCYTTPIAGPTGDFAPSDCDALIKIGPGEDWSSNQAMSGISAGPGSACLAIQDDSVAKAPVCVADLNGRQRGRSYILIDGPPSTVSQGNGTVSTYLSCVTVD